MCMPSQPHKVKIKSRFMTSFQNPTAGLVIIGNEILSGRTQDKNIAYIATHISAQGIVLKEVRIVPDEAPLIIEAVNTLRQRYDVVITTGGIGTTHDDITAAAIAEAFGLSLRRNAEAARRLIAAYGDRPDILETGLTLADIPEGATLIDNTVTVAPGFRVENVYVLAGVPQIMQAMLQGILDTLPAGQPFLTATLSGPLSEGLIAAPLAALQNRYPDVAMGSYPTLLDKKWHVSIVLRSPLKTRLEAATAEVASLFKSLGISPTVEI